MNIPFDEYQERVVLEKVALDQKLAELDALLRSDQFLTTLQWETDLLVEQYRAMRQYSGALGTRITQFICAALLKADS